MQDQNSQIITFIIIGTSMALILVLFIVTIVFLYQKRQQQHERDVIKLKEEFDQELLRSQLEIQETTLKNISQELHDNVGQMLSVVKLSLASSGLEKVHPAFETIAASRDILNKAIIDLANLTKSLHTDRINQIGLVQAIEFEITSIHKTGLIPIEFKYLSGENHQNLDEHTSIFLFRIFQEILNNTLKHSKASQIVVTTGYTNDNTFILKMEDDGIGFNIDEKINKTASTGGVGLKSMNNRAKLIGAKLIMNSTIGKGTCITITLPLKKESLFKEV